MDKLKSVKVTFTFENTFTEAINEAIRDGEISSRQEIVDWAREWMAEDINALYIDDLYEGMTVELEE